MSTRPAEPASQVDLARGPLPETSGLDYPLRITIGWPLSRQRIRIRDRRRRTIFRMLVHLERPAWCEVHAGGDASAPSFVIEAERFYSQSRTYRILDRGGGAAGWLEYEGKVSIVEATFRLYRRSDSTPAFRVSQTKVGPRWLSRVVGSAVSEYLAYLVTRPHYLVAAMDGTPIMLMNQSQSAIRRLCVIRRLAPSINTEDETLCLLGLSVVAACEVTRRRGGGAV